MVQKQLMDGHSPTLNTVLMVEHTLRDASEQLTVAELKRELPKQVMHNTLLRILDYLQLSGKILVGTKGIIWVYEPNPKILEAMAKGIRL